MSLRSTVEERLLTWLDVERLLKQRTTLWTQLPAGVLGVDCFADGMEIRYASEASLVEDWLNKVFGHAYDDSRRVICLRIAKTYYPVELIQETVDLVPAVGQAYPLWRDVTYLSDAQEESATDDVMRPKADEIGVYPRIWKTGPDLVSFHSFKGGVGRTTALMTYVAACMQEASESPKKILIVDADLEAPGISFWLDEVNCPTVSFVQLLEALHYPPAEFDVTLNFFAEELRKTSLSIAGMQRELFVLPAALDLAEIQDMPVVPEHLARNPSNPWQLSDHLHRLGQLLGADAVFIDLRAGLSELASPILFDPRVDHFFISTVAPQSVQGMAEVLRRLYAFNRRLPNDQQDNARPTVVLSLLTKELREGIQYGRAIEALSKAYPSDDTLSPGVQWLEAEFLSTLMSISSVREALVVLPQSSRLFASATEWVKALYATPQTQEADTVSPALSFRQTQAINLNKVCKTAEFADSSSSDSILTTEPLLNLGKHYSKELPNLLMIGAKGSGKTFAYRQLVRMRSWQAFLEKLGFDAASIVDATIFPVLWSNNIEDRPDGEIKGAQVRALELIRGNEQDLLVSSELSRQISEFSRQIKVASGETTTSWEDFWDGLMAKQMGVATGKLNDLNQVLASQSNRIIFVFDGIEDAFADATEEHAIDAIQALLRLPNRVSELNNRHIGVMIFVRADYVQATVRQNLGQLLQRFQPFRLQWNPESCLRLAFMLSCQAGILSDDEKLAETLRVEQLKDKLEILWGKKLGNEKSKEAYSARWVYTALCDLKGNVQARDLVRFLRFASDLESVRTGSTWPSRILSPESMRKAIPECSREKVAEAKQEVAPLRKWITRMEDNGVRGLRVPFSPVAAQLDAGSLSALQEIGVIYEDLDGDLGEERLFLPEIYRYGLGFETSAAGRPRTQALLKKNIGSIPL
ncbi:MAG: KGGVGR-motif variant AAA ATPase [Leptospirillum sp.]